MKKVNQVYEALVELEKKNKRGISAKEISEVLNTDRANVSRYLNMLYRDNRVAKIEGRPVLYKSIKSDLIQRTTMGNKNSLNKIIGAKASLRTPIQQARAAILYPPNGLHTLILGETGVGKSMFAELMYQFAKESKIIEEDAPFIQFNCADYAENPQLIMSQIFGVKKGAYTGADCDKEGLLKKADRGILFLDEVHRLSPQGQEMLFTFIDKGYFRPLGETEKVIYVDVRIIAATTEDPQSYLLKTFTRRIPMTIVLPALRDKGMAERYELIESCIKRESKRIGKSIYVNRNSLISLLLYDCPNNIGQLKSDIQLACAKAFVKYKSKEEKYILISQSDLPQHVKRGLMKIQNNREEIDRIFKGKGDILRFYYKDDKDHNISPQYQVSKGFYDVIEKKLEALKNAGIEDKEIDNIINLAIESHFRKYIENLPKGIEKNEISEIVDIEILKVVEEILNFAGKRLKREYDEKIYFGLALHLHGCIERLQSGNKIYNPKLNMIRVDYPNEFVVAMEIARIIDDKFNIETPLDEIGYLTMFLASNTLGIRDEEKAKVGILVIMHGKSTASSMVEVVNNLVGGQHAKALDMPLNMKPQTMYEIAKQHIKEMDRGKGIIVMVDMGSLTNFGDMIYEETGIIVKTIDMVSTPIVINACRKAILGQDLNEIYTTCKQMNLSNKATARRENINDKNIIITACFTGEGASERLKRIIEDKLYEKNSIEIIPLNILDRREFLCKIDQYREKHKILAVVSTIDINLNDIQCISAAEVLKGEGIKKIINIVKEEDLYLNIGKSLKEHMMYIDGKKIVDDVRYIVDSIEESLNIQVVAEVKVGIILHLSFLIDKLCGNGKETHFEDLEEYKNQYSRELIIIKDCLRSLESNYNIEIGENELAYICKMFMLNKEDI
ncbi:sigma 54-interacting transcriptional regulator [Paramaledivibacter caminithermalis]|uniref:Sigma 54 modulation protein n=1 Tax=Paramaledivibacter caminithermalis (strain DSM 15212 / CIP 107654 / DViRD3) TaxID=1121301 RepID=A0A1M6PGF3_PARC5|nr:sigma-54-dependent transcriptional regulator [Paramaledivibacter caminithermalis]SHK07029.1 sigma 54 modulation protein [Paramaledivibacter caminithermalis DSM 15212]